MTFSSAIVFNNFGLGGVQKKIFDLYKAGNKDKDIYLFFRDKTEFSYTKLIDKKYHNKIFFSPYQGKNLLLKHFVFLVYLIFYFWKLNIKSVLVFFHFAAIYVVISKTILFFRNIKVIVSEDNVLSKYNKKPYTNQTFPKVFIKFIFWLVDKIITQTNFAKNDLIYNFGIKNSKIIVIYNWCLNRDRLVGKKEWDIIFMGRISPQKRLDRVLKVFKKIANENSNSKFLILGSGDDKIWDQIKKDIDRLRLDKNITLKEASFNPTKFLVKSKFLILCSDFEGQPMVVIEAMKRGVIPMVIRFSGVNEYTEDGQTALIAGNEESLSRKYLKVSGDLPRLLKMQNKVRDESKRFGPKNLNQVLSLLTDSL